MEDRLRETAVRLRAELHREPRDALRAVVGVLASVQRADAALARVVRDVPFGNGPVDAARAEIRAALEQVCDRAHHVGALRADLTAADVHGLVCAIASTTPRDPDAGDRYVEVLFDGLAGAR